MGSELADGIARAIQKEREECARLLEAPFDNIKTGNPAIDGFRAVMKAAADAIRARGKAEA